MEVTAGAGGHRGRGGSMTPTWAPTPGSMQLSPNRTGDPWHHTANPSFQQPLSGVPADPSRHSDQKVLRRKREGRAPPRGRFSRASPWGQRRVERVLYAPTARPREGLTWALRPRQGSAQVPRSERRCPR